MKYARWVRGTALAVSAVVVAVALVVVTQPSAAEAADSRLFDPGFIISDEVFYDGTAATQGEIQTALNERGSSCRAANGLECLKNFRADIAGSAADQWCEAISPESAVPSARVFVVVGQACGINPQVLVALVEKEQSLVTRSAPSEYSYRYATGYNCPDTTGCDTASSGFYRQVYLAAKQFERYRLNPTGFNHRAGQVNQVRYSPNAACGSSAVFIRNTATAALYNYTPYQPNAAAIANLYGTGDGCSSYGNRNFWRIFTDWFGNPSNLLSAPSFEGSATNWKLSRSDMNYAVYRSESSFSGQHFLAANTHTAGSGSSVVQTVAVQPQAGESYTATVWLRSSRADRNFEGTVTLWALGEAQEYSDVRYSVGAEWTQFVIPLEVTRGGHSALRLEIYLDSNGLDVFVDAASLYRSASRPSRASIDLQSPGLETGMATWGPKNGDMNRVVYADAGLAHTGTRFLATNTSMAFRSIGQDVRVQVEPGQTVTATVWLRRGLNGNQPFRGQVSLWAIGSEAEGGSTKFEVGANWTQIQVELPITRSASTLRFEVYLESTGYDLFVDDVAIRPSLLTNSGFQTGTTEWSAGADASIEARSSGVVGEAVDGSGYAVVNASRTGASVSSSVERLLVVGEEYRAGVWLRATDPARPFTGTVALWALGTGAESASVPVTVGGTWTYVEVRLPITRTGGSTLRLELFHDAPGVEVLLDAARLY